ncbi:MAG: alkaline phosphatase PhoX [Acidimicrobiia bacterium]
MTSIDRRSFLRRSAIAAGGAAAAAGPLSALTARAAGAQPGGRAPRSRAGTKDGAYGPLVDMGDLLLPEGFRYVAFGVQGSELPLTRGGATAGILPRGHDGMASFATTTAGLVRLVRNHENRDQVSPLGGAGYNPMRFGGTTTLEFDVSDPTNADLDTDRYRGQWVSLQGTSTNCAGGPTPWGSWMTCEETVENFAGVDHGYVFDVPAAADGPVEPLPLKAMGRFVHEAVAIDPRTNIAYETEDRRISGPGTGSGFYRFVPQPGVRYGTAGRLEMLAIKDRPQYDTSVGQRVGQVLPVTWVPIDEPDPAGGGSQAVFQQGWERGGAAFQRLEGAWYGDGSIFFISTNGGDPHPAGDPGLGQVWQYIPRGSSGGQLVLLVESSDPTVMEAPDNVTVSPRGGLLACEDGDGAQYLRGVTSDGRVFDFATHTLPGSNEFAGANWSPDGHWLFVNVQTPGTTFAITGPWERGAL